MSDGKIFTKRLRVTILVFVAAMACAFLALKIVSTRRMNDTSVPNSDKKLAQEKSDAAAKNTNTPAEPATVQYAEYASSFNGNSTTMSDSDLISQIQQDQSNHRQQVQQQTERDDRREREKTRDNDSDD